MPLGYILTGYLLQKLSPGIKYICFGLLLSGNAAFAIPVLFPTPESAVKQFLHDWQYGYFRDMYGMTTADGQQSMLRTDFDRTGAKFFHDAEIETAYLKPSYPHLSRTRSPQYIPLTITYVTRRLGPFTESVMLPVVNGNGIWKIPWKWDYLAKDFSPSRDVITEVAPATRGSLLASDKKKLAEDVPGMMISVIPGQVDRETEPAMLETLSRAFDRSLPEANIAVRYRLNRQPDWPVPIGVVPVEAKQDILETLRTYRAITLSPAAARMQRQSTILTVGTVGNSVFFECCSRLYSTTNYDGTDGAEKTKNTILKGENGGTLTIVDKKMEIIRMVISKEKKNGIDTEPQTVPSLSVDDVLLFQIIENNLVYRSDNIPLGKGIIGDVLDFRTRHEFTGEIRGIAGHPHDRTGRLAMCLGFKHSVALHGFRKDIHGQFFLHFPRQRLRIRLVSLTLPAGNIIRILAFTECHQNLPVPDVNEGELIDKCIVHNLLS